MATCETGSFSAAGELFCSRALIFPFNCFTGLTVLSTQPLAIAAGIEVLDRHCNPEIWLGSRSRRNLHDKLSRNKQSGDELLKVENSPMFLKPTYFIDGDITTLDIEQLCADGIKGLIIDLDSTLMESKSGVITTETSIWLEAARLRLKMVVLSNNKRMDYLKGASTVLGMEVIGHAAKPFAQGFKQALKVLDLPPEEVAVIGDRPLTDILGGKWSNMRTVLVRPLATIVEPRWKSFLRNVERIVIRP